MEINLGLFCLKFTQTFYSIGLCFFSSLENFQTLFPQIFFLVVVEVQVPHYAPLTPQVGRKGHPITLVQE